MIHILLTIFFVLITICPCNSIDNEYPFSNFDLQPNIVTINSTGTAKFICTKQIDDGEDIEFSSNPKISSNRLMFYSNQHNTTLLEIGIKAFGYMGIFHLICSAKGKQGSGNQADVIIGDKIEELTQIGSCIVYENRYIDCVIRSARIVNAYLSNFPCKADFSEIHSTSTAENAYRPLPEKVRIDDENKIVTYRWLPVDEGMFPSGLQMEMTGSMGPFGTKNLTIDMTPKFYMKPNFTIELIPTSSFQIHLNHHFLPSSSFCHGNLTFDDEFRSAQPEDDVRRFKTMKSSTVKITHLSANTRYQLCVQCHGDKSRQTISPIQCQRIQTKAQSWWKYLVIISLVVFSMIILIIIWKRHNLSKCIHQKESGDTPLIDNTHSNDNPIVLNPTQTSFLPINFEVIPLRQPFSNSDTMREIPPTIVIHEVTEDGRVFPA